ncbi:hypothetical protein KFE25_003398 [Diacronema lutheri]|uniref:Uncharacterized protein n=1 Tax=Diacronema lutheri TaxID=2081491 RepID=A0A8J5XRZ0_DIALT|nr:hypothetical protein KFE25_003398 [Diacronema lutheri]
MYIGPWQEYVLGKALAQAKLSSTPNTRPATAAGEFPDLPAAHRLARPCSSLSAPSEFGGGSVRATARAQRARPGPSAGGGRGRGSQLGKKQQLQRMQTMYGMRGNTPGARAVQLAASALDDDEGDELTPLPETRRSPIARDAPASQQHPPSAARFPPRPAPPDAVAIGAQLLGWAPRAYSGAHAEASSPLGYDSHVSTRAVHSPVVRGGHAQPQHRAPAEAALLLASTGGEIESWRQAALPPPWHEGAQWRAQPCSEPPRSGSRAATPPAAPAPALARGAPFARADTTGLSSLSPVRPPRTAASQATIDDLDEEVDDLLEWTRRLGTPTPSGTQAGFAQLGENTDRGSVTSCHTSIALVGAERSALAGVGRARDFLPADVFVLPSGPVTRAYE